MYLKVPAHGLSREVDAKAAGADAQAKMMAEVGVGLSNFPDGALDSFRNEPTCPLGMGGNASFLTPKTKRRGQFVD